MTELRMTPLDLAKMHHSAIIEHAAKVIAHQGGLRQLFVGRRVKIAGIDQECFIMEVKFNGSNVPAFYGRAKGSRRKRQLCIGINQIRETLDAESA